MRTDRDTDPGLDEHLQDDEATVTRVDASAWRPSGRRILGAVIHGVVAYAAAWLMAVLVVILALTSLARSDTGGSPALPDELTGAVEAGVDGDPLAWWPYSWA